MKELDTEPEKSVMIGDTPIDILASKNAGIYSIAVTSGISMGITTLNKIYGANPDLIINSMKELPEHMHLK
ncbi:MAG: HAD hydrolase-like protein [Candidatus Aenigmarchaeota archaeon]|nr:HAD hydrolase-like protein [Candidatus Aenigmarchaeota archaeon]MDI6722877.1 HAD hydrolase-like protein [Candidatus Aenigmarchaeota archaeon]